LISNLGDGDPLEDGEAKPIARFEELLGGKWFNIGNPQFGRG
jgi:hypothetical protein